MTNVTQCKPASQSAAMHDLILTPILSLRMAQYTAQDGKPMVDLLAELRLDTGHSTLKCEAEERGRFSRVEKKYADLGRQAYALGLPHFGFLNPLDDSAYNETTCDKED